MDLTRRAGIRDIYRLLYDAWGCQHWWPAQSRFEVIVGAYLTQNTSWTNVEVALAKLRSARLLTIEGIRRTPEAKLATLIRSSGYFRQKARRLKVFVSFLDTRYGGSLSRMFGQPTGTLREELLTLNGVGPETADSILLYAGNHPVFVVDAYTRRVLERHEILSATAGYEEIRRLCEAALAEMYSTNERSRERKAMAEVRVGPGGSCHRPSRVSEGRRTALVQGFNEMHGLVVGVGKNYCLKSQARCEECPLQKLLPAAE